MLFRAARTGRPRRWQIIAGQYLGFATLVALSLLVASGLVIIPDQWVGLVGLSPPGLGVWD